MVTLKNFGSRVAKARKAKGFSQEKLGEMANLHPTYVSGIERGVRNPSLIIVMRVAKALSLKVGDLAD
jgi:transcriptional regulator with XRE-family HTH domain